jgi:hypothetical protein
MNSERFAVSLRLDADLSTRLRRLKKLLRDFSGYDSLVFAKTTRSHTMAWTEITRPKYQRDALRYASDTTDEEWATLVKVPPA